VSLGEGQRQRALELDERNEDLVDEVHVPALRERVEVADDGRSELGLESFVANDERLHEIDRLLEEWVAGERIVRLRLLLILRLFLLALLLRGLDLRVELECEAFALQLGADVRVEADRLPEGECGLLLPDRSGVLRLLCLLVDLREEVVHQDPLLVELLRELGLAEGNQREHV